MAAVSESTDRELLQAHLDGRDAESLGTFVSRYQGPLLRFAVKLLKDEEAAQDVVQETFLTVARNPGRLLGVVSCHNWLLRVARNIGVGHLRRAAVLRRHAPAIAERAAGEAAERERQEAAELERKELHTRVRAEIDRLSPRHRELVLLRVQEEKSYREIAEITGLSVTNVGYLLHMAMKTLARRLKDAREELP
jgi:RNA polymerase sigma-70 factor (ECF subfamily)